MLGAVVTQHDHTLAVDLRDDSQNWAVPSFEGHFQPHPQLAQRLQIFLILQFIDALTDIPVQLQ